jgi:GntR family transcriptional regulator / MocR family aminotransferase
MTKTRVPLLLRDRHAGLQESLYSSVLQSLREQLIYPGARLPSSRALAQQLGVSRTTVLLVMDRLEAEGYVRARPGSGTFVANELPETWLEAPAQPTESVTAAPVMRLSERGQGLAAIIPVGRRIVGHARPFRLGSPALDQFPTDLWRRLLVKRSRSLSASLLDYSWPWGHLHLREAIAGLLRSRGSSCVADQVVVVGGSQRALDIIGHLMLDPGDVAWVEDPGYPGAWSAFHNSSVRTVPIPVDEQGLNIGWAERHAEPAKLVYTTPSHQFPLGLTMGMQRRQALLAWAERKKAWIVEDDYDCEFHFRSRPIPSLHALDRYGHVVYLGTFSKNFFPALRLGYCVVPQHLASAVYAARLATDLHPPVLEQLVLADFIVEGHYDRHLRRMRKVYAERLEALYDSAKEYCSGVLDVHEVDNGLHTVGKLEGVTGEQVYERAVARDVDVTPLSPYWLSRERQTWDGLLLGFGAVRPESIRDGMRRLAEAIEVAQREQ